MPSQEVNYLYFLRKVVALRSLKTCLDLVTIVMNRHSCKRLWSFNVCALNIHIVQINRHIHRIKKMFSCFASATSFWFKCIYYLRFFPEYPTSSRQNSHELSIVSWSFKRTKHVYNSSWILFVHPFVSISTIFWVLPGISSLVVASLTLLLFRCDLCLEQYPFVWISILHTLHLPIKYENK